jgi:hypothetical protein
MSWLSSLGRALDPTISTSITGRAIATVPGATEVVQTAAGLGKALAGARPVGQATTAQDYATQPTLAAIPGSSAPTSGKSWGQQLKSFAQSGWGIGSGLAIVGLLVAVLLLVRRRR